MSLQRRNGFTLIEILIAMTLLGVMVVLLFSSLRIAAESWNAGEHKITAVNRKAVVYQFFKRHLTTIRPLPALGNGDDADFDSSQPVFHGYLQNLRFVASLPVSSARKGLQIFDISLDPEQPSTIQVSLTPYRQTESGPIDPPVVLLDHVADLKFAYFGKTEDIAELVWSEEWTVTDRLPSLIKVSITLDDGSYWPEMVFPLKITSAYSPTLDGDGSEEQEQEAPDVDTR